MRFILTFIFLICGALFGISVAPTLFYLAPIDTGIIILFALVTVWGERRTISAAIFLGFFADLWSALPFGTFTIAFPALLAWWYVLGYYVFTNRSWWAEGALTSLGTLLVHLVAWVTVLVAGALSRLGGVPPLGWQMFIGETIRSMILTATIAASAAFIIRKVQALYGQKFLTRGMGH